MTDKERIRQEIERRITDNTFGAKLELIDILAWLDTLSEEPDKSLEEAANNHIRKVVDAAGHPGWDWTTQDIMDAFKAGAEWKYQKDRAKFAKLKAKEWSDGYDEGIIRGKEQMMEEAVEADVNTYKNLEEGTSWAEFVVEMPTNKLGDKVRIIIVKEDEK